MFFILLGIVLGVLTLIMGIRFGWDEYPTINVIIIFILVGIIVGVFVPISGYEEPVISEEIELVSLTDEVASTGGGIVYVNIDASNVYTYRFEVDSKFAMDGDKAYESDTKSGDVVTVIEGDSYTTAKLVEYESRPKKSFWTFGVFASEYEYVFYVPKGTIKGNIVLD